MASGRKTGGPARPSPTAMTNKAQRKPDITLAIERLGWQPSVGLRQGLEATIDYSRGKLEMAESG